jgi:hypothetical protein
VAKPIERPPCPITGDIATRRIQTWSQNDLRRFWTEDIGIDTKHLLDGGQTISLWHAEKSDLQFFHPIVTGNDAFYEALHAKRWYFQPDKWEFHEAARHISDTDRILDLGAGQQPFGAYVAPENYFAVDPLVQGNAAPAQQPCDVVCAFQVLEHVADPLAFMTDTKSRTKPEGLIFVGVPNRHSYLSDLSDFALDMPPHHVSRWSEKALAALADAAKLHIEAITQSPLEPWEVSLYWMSRLEKRLPQSATNRNRLSRIIAYGAARCLSAFAPDPQVAGGSLLMRARLR